MNVTLTKTEAKALAKEAEEMAAGETCEACGCADLRVEATYMVEVGFDKTAFVNSVSSWGWMLECRECGHRMDD